MKVNEQIQTTSSIVEIFKTNVDNQQLASKIVADLNQLHPEYGINFDLEDCDNILRIESSNKIDVLFIMNYSNALDIHIERIDY
ncbi:methyltransferase type 11 [Flavobacteriaceae bacterium F08102]|nr:methyltransferase type 11 [Flavobacteriaceae bacterium F08102]